MILVRRGHPPKDLERLRQKGIKKGWTPKRAYSELKNPLKTLVRQQLVDEQGGLCAYCMCKIPRNDVSTNMADKAITIEHYIPRDPLDGRDVGQGLDYNNFLAVCHGNQAPHGICKEKDLTCDAHRRNIEFKKVNPCNPSTLKSIFYHLDGRIDASDSDVKFDLTDTLNLNCPNAPQLGERKAALDALIFDIGKQNGDTIQTYCVQVLNMFQLETNPKTPYVGILIWYLQTIIDSFNT